MRRRRTPRLFLTLLLVAVALHAESEAERLITLLELRSGMAVADIGAGDGELTVELARRLGPATVVYSTELRKELPSLRRAVGDAKLENITVVEAGLDRTNLPANCCDAIFLRRVYHHFQNPARNNRSAFQSLRPGGRLAVIDFQPRKHWKAPKGVHHRGGHGVERKAVIRELTAAGFELVRVMEDWPEDMYAVLVRKPGPGLPVTPLRSGSRR